MSHDESAPPFDPAGTVLCIEDQPISMDVVEAMLGTYPRIRLVKAFTGGEGVRLVERERPDLVLLDMNLPDMSGLEVVRALSVQISTHGLRVVLLTSDSFSIDVVKAMSFGAHEYWPKPLTLERAASGLRRVLGEGAARP
ncbi:MAG: response regulator [Caldimonas sp.]